MYQLYTGIHPRSPSHSKPALGIHLCTSTPLPTGGMCFILNIYFYFVSYLPQMIRHLTFNLDILQYSLRPVNIQYFSENKPHFLKAAPHQNGSFVFVHRILTRTEIYATLDTGTMIPEPVYGEPVHSYYSCFQILTHISFTLLKKNSKLHTNPTTAHTKCKMPRFSCKMKHCNQNITNTSQKHTFVSCCKHFCHYITFLDISYTHSYSKPKALLS